MDERRRLSTREVILILVGAAILGGPAIAMVELQLGPGRWIVALEDNLFGYHFPVTSAAILMLVEIVLIGAIILPLALAVRWVTGKTLVELLRRSE